MSFNNTSLLASYQLNPFDVTTIIQPSPIRSLPLSVSQHLNTTDFNTNNTHQAVTLFFGVTNISVFQPSCNTFTSVIVTLHTSTLVLLWYCTLLILGHFGILDCLSTFKRDHLV